jgi:hypothetical protein
MYLRPFEISIKHKQKLLFNNKRLYNSLLSSIVTKEMITTDHNKELIDHIDNDRINKGFKPYYLYRTYCRMTPYSCTYDLVHIARLLGYAPKWIDKARHEIQCTTHKWAYMVG